MLASLKTFLHISDLHFSDRNLDPQALMLYATIPKMDGFLGHSYKSLTVLDAFFAELVRDEAAELILTGDVTRTGGLSEFDLARTYLEQELVPPKGNYVGL